MNKETEQALRDSIAHWERLRDTVPSDDTEETPSGEHCPLCDAFYAGELGADACEDCPVASLTGHTHCEGTPYYTARNAWDEIKNELFQGESGSIVTWIKAAQAEIDFLESLLPEDAS